jgi:hypothetical protein
MSGPQLTFEVSQPLLVLVVAALLVAQPVSVDRLARFARRHAVTLTDENRHLAVRYLATTRRWRTAGVVISIAISSAYTWWHSRTLGWSALGMFAGWFAGAIIAEWRLTLPASGERRVASLVPRRLRDYLGPWALWTPVGLWALVLAVALRGLIEGPEWPLVWGPLALLATGVVIVTVGRHVLNRAQPAGALDLVAVDDALRSRSLHVLAGSAVAAGGYLASIVIGYLAQWGRWFDGGGLSWWSAVGLLACPLVGVAIATASTRPRTRTSEAVVAA